MITIVLLSHNNPDHLKRALLFYKKTEFKGRILIADSSEDKIKVKEVLSLVQERLFAPLLFEYESSISFPKKVSLICKEVVTEYVLLAGVDDFFLPSFLYESIWFLKNNKDYLFVYGKQYGFTFNQIQFNCYYTGYFDELMSFDDNFCVDRLIKFFPRYKACFYAVFRTEIVKKIALSSSVFSETLVVFDNLFVMLALLHGKAKYIKKPFHFRELSEESYGYRLNSSWLEPEVYKKNSFSMISALFDFFISNKIFSSLLAFQKAEELIKTFFSKRSLLTFSVSQKYRIINHWLPEQFTKKVKSILFWTRNVFIDSGSVYLNNEKTLYSLEFRLFKQLVRESQIIALRSDLAFVKKI